jgi:hypothetical protein
MKSMHRWMTAGLLIAALALTACAKQPAPPSDTQVARADPISGMAVKRVTLPQKGADRIGLKTEPVRDAQMRGAARKVIPYAAVLYDVRGDTWAFAPVEALRFVRQPIKIDYIEGDRAVLLEGPPAGTAVVTVGATELLGVELGVGK